MRRRGNDRMSRRCGRQVPAFLSHSAPVLLRTAIFRITEPKATEFHFSFGTEFLHDSSVLFLELFCW